MSTQPGKDTIYIDVDDEITAVIDKVRGSGQKIVALVLPKRATVFQSIVNMKLLKRSADEAKKHLVLITSEASLMPLAGAVGVHVAKTLQSKPEIPLAPNMLHANDVEEVEESVNMADGDLDTSKPVGEHLRNAPPSVASPALQPLPEEDEAIELDNGTPVAAAAAAGGAGKAAKKAGKKDSKLKIPDFNKFRLWMVLGAAGLILLIVLWYVAVAVMPRASVAVKTDSTAVHTNMNLALDTNASGVDLASATLPAQMQQTQKTTTQQAPATGQQNNGQKATGQVTLTAQVCGTIAQPQPVPAGSGVSGGGLTFITQQTTSFSSDSPKIKNGCLVFQANGPTPVAAQAGGAQYNIAPTTFTVAGRSDVSGQSTSAMAGGTDNVIKVVSQADIDGAKQKLTSQDTTSVKAELRQDLQNNGLTPIDATFAPSDPAITTSANVGDQTDNVTVTQKVTYTMMGVKQSDLQTIIANQVKKEIDPTKQKILDYGLGSATYKLQNQQNGQASVNIDDTAVAGSDLNLTAIKSQIAGKKSADVKSIIGGYPGVTNVTVNYSPFWVSSVPKSTSKITVTVEKPPVKNAQ